MKFENLNSKQFRGRRTRNGKLIRNKIGGYERSRVSRLDADYDTRRREFKLAIVENERLEGLAEALASEPLNSVGLLEGSDFTGDSESLYDEQLDCSMVIRYGADGKIVSFHMPDDSYGYGDYGFDD